MAPKKSKAQNSSAPSVPEPQRAARGRKRRDSDVSNVSERPSSSQSVVSTTSATPSKRRKKGKVAVAQTAPEAIIEEVDEVVEDPEQDHAVSISQITVLEPSETVSTSQTEARHVHFGSNPNDAHLASDDIEPSTATHMTPHPRKMAIKRRISFSPGAATNGSSKRVKVSSTRTSLPPSLSQDDQDPFYILEELQFAPLKEVLRERVKRRWEIREERDAQIHELGLEIETQRQLGNEERVKEIDAELLRLYQERKEAQETHDPDYIDLTDENMLVLDSQEEATYPQLGNTSNGFRSSINIDAKLTSAVLTDEVAAAVASERSAWNVERRSFEDAILALSRESNEAKTKLQILEIELQALGLAPEGVASTAILLSIRETFSRVRESLQAVLPNSIAQGASHLDVIEILIANVTEFAERLQNADKEMSDKSTLVTDLGNQVHRLVDHLADAEIRKQRLEQRWGELDSANEGKSREIEELLEELEGVQEERDVLRGQVQDKTAEIKTVQRENLEFARNMDRLSTALKGYQTEEARLTALIEKMEVEEEIKVAKMNAEREETVRDLESQLDTQTELRSQAEDLAEHRQQTIVTLEIRIEEVEVERDSTREQLATMILEKDAQLAGREIAETDLREREAEIEDLEGRVSILEDELVVVNKQLDELRALNETERTQRQAAEDELYLRNAELEDIRKKLIEQGTQANELRQKLFEVQQVNERRVKELEGTLAERDVQYESTLADEVDQRDEAVALAEDRATLIIELEARIVEVEAQMAALLVTHEEHITAFEKTVAQKDSELKALRDQLQTTLTTFEAREVHQSRKQKTLEDEIVALQTIIVEREATIAFLEQEGENTAASHAVELEDRDTKILGLNGNISTLRIEIASLEKQKGGLERRVEDEAEQMLQLQVEKDEEIESLKAAILDKQEKIMVVEQKAIETDNRWQEVLEARDEEILSLRANMESRTQTVTTMTSQLDTMKQKFRAYVERSAIKIAHLQRALASAKAVVEEESEAVRADGEGLLEEMEAMDFVGELTTITTSQSQSAAFATQESSSSSKKKVRGGRKKRVQDSGIGLDADDELLEA